VPTPTSQTAADSTWLGENPYTFFSDRLALGYNGAQRGEPALLAARALAAWLTVSEPTAARPSYRTARRDPRLRLQRARILLAEVEHAELANSSRADELWSELHEEWAWVGKDPFVRQLLVEHARGTSIAESGTAAIEAVVTATLSGIQGELIPGLHLKWLLASRATSQRGSAGRHTVSRHWDALGQWQLADDVSPAQLQLYTWYVMALADAEREPPPVVHATIQRLVTLRGLRDSGVARLVHALVILRRLALVKRLTNPTASQWWLEERLKEIDALVEAGGSTAELLELASLVHVALGVVLSATYSTYAAGATHIVTAVVLDPISSEAQRQLQRIRELPDAVSDEVSKLERAGRASANAGAIAATYRRGTVEALALFDTPEAQALRHTRREAALWSLAYRLGTDPNDAVTHGAFDALLATLDASARRDDVQPDSYPAQVREATLQSNPGAAHLPWERILPALGQGVLPLGDCLPYQFPEPVPLDVGALGESLRESAVDSVRPVPSATRRDQASAWLFGRKDLGYKIAAALGAAALVLVTTSRARGELRARHLGNDYRAVLSAVRAGNDSAASEAGLAFLSAGPDSADERVPQVKEWVRVAVLRRVIALTETHRSAEAKPLLERYSRRFAPLDKTGGDAR